jgi:MFS family permease
MPTETRRFSASAAMWIVAAEIGVIYLLSTIPTPLYVVYRQAFHFSQITLTIIYAVYVLGTITAMFFLGRLADQIGRRPVVLASLAIAGVSAGVFLLAKHTAWLYPARILSGLAIALASGASTAWVTELEPGHDRTRATRFVIAANLLGLGLGALFAGILAQESSSPLRLPYAVFLAPLILVAFLVWRSKETVQNPKSLAEASARPRLGVPRNLRQRFISPAACAFAVFSVLGFYSSLIPSLLSESLHNRNHAVAGAVVAELFVVGAAAVIVVRALRPRTGLVLSLALLLPSVATLVVAEAAHSMTTLLIGTAVAGVATGLGYGYSLGDLNELAPDDKRSEMVSTYLIACYCGISLPVIGVGVLGRATGSLVADAIFAGMIALLAVTVLILQARLARHAKLPE